MKLESESEVELGLPSEEEDEYRDRLYLCDRLDLR